METKTRPQSSRDRLNKKLKDKRAQRAGKIPEVENETDILSMISQVQSMLKNSPELVNKVSSCVNSLMSNPELMQQLSCSIQGSSQTLDINSSGESSQAVSKES